MKRIVYIDFLRDIGMIAVILLHTAAHGISAWDINTFDWDVAVIYNSLVRWAVPIFVMVSGATLLSPESPISTKQLYRGNILKLVIVFCVWSFAYALGNCGGSIDAFWREFITGHYHMWYLYMMIGLYICVPILRAVTKSKQLTEYFLVVALIFTFIIPTAFNFLSLWDQAYGTEMYTFAQSVLKKMWLHLVLGYTSLMVAGYYLHTNELKPAVRKIIYVLGILGFLMTSGLTIEATKICGEPFYLFIEYPSVGILLESLAVFTFAKYNTDKIFSSEKSRNFLIKLARYGLGVYLIHAAVLQFMQDKLAFGGNTFNPVICIPLVVLAVFAISLIISAILSKIPFVNKYLV